MSGYWSPRSCKAFEKYEVSFRWQRSPFNSTLVTSKCQHNTVDRSFATWIALGAVFQFLQIPQMFLRCFWVNILLLKKFLFLSASLVGTFHSFSILNGHTSFLYISLVLYTLFFWEWLQIFTYKMMKNERAVLCNCKTGLNNLGDLPLTQ